MVHNHREQYFFANFRHVEVRLSVSIPVNDVINFIDDYLQWNKTWVTLKFTALPHYEPAPASPESAYKCARPRAGLSPPETMGLDTKILVVLLYCVLTVLVN